MNLADVIEWAVNHAAPGVSVEPLRGAVRGLVINDGEIRWRQTLLKDAGEHTVHALLLRFPLAFAVTEEDRLHFARRASEILAEKGA